MNMERNDLTYAILQAIDKAGSSTAIDVWEALEDDISLDEVIKILLSYTRMSLLKRSGTPKTYQLTAKGAARLKWLNTMK